MTAGNVASKKWAIDRLRPVRVFRIRWPCRERSRHPVRSTFDDKFLLRGAQHNDGSLELLLVHGPQDFNAVHLWHPDVQSYNLGLELTNGACFPSQAGIARIDDSNRDVETPEGISHASQRLPGLDFAQILPARGRDIDRLEG